VGSSAYNSGPLGSQEAKDFRVRILLDEPPAALRPGLSTRAEIETERREQALAVPIEALTIRDPEEEQAHLEGKRTPRRRRAAEESGDEGPREVEGVFLVRDGEARFVAVETGIAGEKDFEVLSGLSEGDEVVRGPFEAIRNLESGEKVTRQDEAKRSRPRGGDEEDDGEADEAEDA
jgi:HlyD family secretion protein